MELFKLKKEVLQIISSGDLLKAINKCLSYFNNEDDPNYKNILLISSKYHNLKKNKSRNLITYEQKTIEESIITDSLIDIVLGFSKHRKKTIINKIEDRSQILTLNINHDINLFTEEQKNKLLDAIQSLLSIENQIRIRSIESGSTLVTLELPYYKSRYLRGLISNNQLEYFKVTKSIVQSDLIKINEIIKNRKVVNYPVKNNRLLQSNSDLINKDYLQPMIQQLSFSKINPDLISVASRNTFQDIDRFYENFEFIKSQIHIFYGSHYESFPYSIIESIIYDLIEEDEDPELIFIERREHGGINVHDLLVNRTFERSKINFKKLIYRYLNIPFGETFESYIPDKLSIILLEFNLRKSVPWFEDFIFWINDFIQKKNIQLFLILYFDDESIYKQISIVNDLEQHPSIFSYFVQRNLSQVDLYNWFHQFGEKNTTRIDIVLDRFSLALRKSEKIKYLNYNLISRSNFAYFQELIQKVLR